MVLELVVVVVGRVLVVVGREVDVDEEVVEVDDEVLVVVGREVLDDVLLVVGLVVLDEVLVVVGRVVLDEVLVVVGRVVLDEVLVVVGRVVLDDVLVVVGRVVVEPGASVVVEVVGMIAKTVLWARNCESVASNMRVRAAPKHPPSLATTCAVASVVPASWLENPSGMAICCFPAALPAFINRRPRPAGPVWMSIFCTPSAEALASL